MIGHQRFMHIDVLKGVAIFLVVLGHVYYFAANGHTDTIWFFLISSWHMPAFMMLAGYFSGKPLDLSFRGVWRYWVSKAERLLLPLLFIPLLFNWVQHGFSLALPLNMYLFNYWFTYVLFLIFGLFYLQRLGTHVLTRLFRLTSESKKLLVDVAVSLLTIWLVHQIRLYIEVYHLGLYKPTHAQNIDWLYKYFLLGYWLKRCPKLEGIVKSEVVGMLSFFIFVASAYGSFVLGMDWDNGVVLTLSGLVFSYFAASQYVVLPGGSKAQSTLAYLGRESLAIYFTHYLFIIAIPWFTPFVSSLTGGGYVAGWELLLGCFVAVLILLPTLLTIRVIKTNRYLAYLIYGDPLVSRPS